MKPEVIAGARPVALIRRTAAVVGLAMLLAGCATSPESTPTTPGPIVTTTTGAPTTTTSPEVTTTVIPTTSTSATQVEEGPVGATITIEGFSFGNPVDIEAGESVRVVNLDAVSHTWTSESGVFNSGSLGFNEDFAFTFTEAGEYSFFCNFHPSMTGTVSVSG